MAKLTISDLETGDKVHHSSNTGLLMTVREVQKERNEILCRWIDQKGQSHSETFYPEELVKHDPNASGIFFGSI